MKKYISVIFLVLLCAVQNVYADDAKITVSPDVEIKNAEPFGYGKDWDSGYPFLSGNTSSMEPSDMFVRNLKKADVKIPLIRIGGDSSNGYYWKTKVGAPEERSGNEFIKNQGYAEWLKAIYTITPDAQTIVVLNLNDTVENNKDLIRFLTLTPEDANAVGSDGVNWAQKRVDMGIKEPVRVYAFELGNELYPKSNITVENVREGAEAYAAECAAILPQLREVNPNAKFSVLMNSVSMISYSDGVASAEAPARAWNETVINTVKDQVDFVTHHDYFGAQKTSWALVSSRDNYYDVLFDYLEGTDIRVLLSESGTYHSGVPVKLKWGNDSYSDEDDLIIDNSNQLGFALGMGRFLIKAYSMPEIAAVIGYGFTMSEDNNLMNDDGSEGPGTEFWTMYRYCTDDVYRLSAMGLVCDLFAKATEGTPVKTAITSVQTGSEMSDICALAFKKDSGEINLVMVPDADQDTVSNTVTLENIPGYAPYSMSVVSGSSYWSDNTSVTPDGVKTSVQKLSPDTNSVIIPPYSAVSVLYVPESNADNTDTTGEMRVSRDGTLLEITDILYSGHGLENGTLMSLLILKGDVEYENATADDIVAFGQTDLLNGVSYFKTAMPEDAEDGIYRAVVGCGNVVHTKLFEYGEAMDIVNSIKVTCDNNQLSAQVQFNPGAENIAYTAAVLYGEYTDKQLDDIYADRTVVLDSFEKTNQIQELSFLMPDGTLPGKYTLVIGAGNRAYTQVFEYLRPDDKIKITAAPVNESGESVFRMDSCTSISVNVRNVTESQQNITGILAYYQGDRLVSSQTCSIAIEGSESKNLAFDGGVKDADLAKLFIWDAGMSTPYCGVFYIK